MPELKLYKCSFKLTSFSASVWQADMLFGHLCWFIMRRDGAETLQDLLERYAAGQPPILISDGFPSDYLPRPLLPTSSIETDTHSIKGDRVDRERRTKQASDQPWLTLAEFNLLLRGQTIIPTLREQVTTTITTQKNQIDRLTNTAGGRAGQLYEMIQYAVPAVTTYWRVDDEYLTVVQEFLQDLSDTGYGKRKSVGYGQIETFDLQEFDGFEMLPDSNGFVTLSRFVPAKHDPTDGFWKIIIKYGKLGEDLATSGNPFKNPLVQIECGSCFRTNDAREWYGQLLGGVSVQQKVVHYAFAFPVSMKFHELKGNSA